MINMGIEDITHHSKRTQAGNIEKAGTSYDKLVSEMGGENSGNKFSTVPVNVTIESAIQYFKDNAKGDKSNLYVFTAEILEKYRVISKNAVSKAFEEAKSKGIIEVDLNEGVSESGK